MFPDFREARSRQSLASRVLLVFLGLGLAIAALLSRPTETDRTEARDALEREAEIRCGDNYVCRLAVGVASRSTSPLDRP